MGGAALTGGYCLSSFFALGHFPITFTTGSCSVVYAAETPELQITISGVVGPGNLIFNMLSCWILCTLESLRMDLKAIFP